MKYTCEVCNKQFDTVAEAEQCEKIHETEKIKSAKRDFAEAAINDAINAFVAKYKRLPCIEYTKENMKTVWDDIDKKFESTIGALLDTLFDDNE